LKTLKNLTDFEKEVYKFVSKHGEMLTTSIPKRMSGVIPNLKNKGVIEVYKKTTSRWTSRKRKFVRIKEIEGGVN
jgi:hypothetical protein